MENDESANLTNVFAPVEIMLPSLQHKHPVLVYDSKKFPGKSSEWFFHKLNRVSGFNVYRCVRCKSVNEKSKRSGAGSIGVPARIYIQNDHFMNDPDSPYGEHICQFETNPECDSSSVYAKRAILEANKDMRVNPERPMAKYVKMLTLFEDDSGRYGHLDAETKRKAQTILNQVGNGFNARKRGLMLNYQLGKRQKKKLELDELEASAINSIKTELGQEDDVDIEGTESSDSPTALTRIVSPPPVPKPDYYCGGQECLRKFKSVASRTRHRTKMHPDLCFIDTEEDLYVFRKTLEAQQAVHPILTATNTPALPFAVKMTQPLEDYTGYTADDAASAIFQNSVAEMLTTIHTVSCYLPTDEAIHTEFIDDLTNLLHKYIPMQEQTSTIAVEKDEEEQVIGVDC